MFVCGVGIQSTADADVTWAAKYFNSHTHICSTKNVVNSKMHTKWKENKEQKRASTGSVRLQINTIPTAHEPWAIDGGFFLGRKFSTFHVITTKCDHKCDWHQNATHLLSYTHFLYLCLYLAGSFFPIFSCFLVLFYHFSKIKWQRWAVIYYFNLGVILYQHNTHIHKQTCCAVVYLLCFPLFVLFGDKLWLLLSIQQSSKWKEREKKRIK